MCGTKEQKSQRCIEPGASRVSYFKLQGPGLEFPGPLTANSKAARAIAAIAGPTLADKRQLEVQVRPRPGRCPRCPVHVDSESVRAAPARRRRCAGAQAGSDTRAVERSRLQTQQWQATFCIYLQRWPGQARGVPVTVAAGGGPGPAAARAARLWFVLHYIPYIEIVRRLLRNKAFVITIHGHCNK